MQSDKIESIKTYRVVSSELVKEAWSFTALRLVDIGTDYFGIMMLANLDAESLAASSLISTSQVLLRSVNAVLLYYTSILAGQAKGCHDNTSVQNILEASYLFATIISIPSIAVAFYSAPLLKILGQSDAIAELTQTYLRSYAFAIPPILLTVSNQQLLSGLGYPNIALIVNVLSRPLTLAIAYPLMYGKLHLPKAGVMGLGFANVVSYALNYFITIGIFKWHKEMREWLSNTNSSKETLRFLVELIKKGIPIGVYSFVELGSLSFAALLAGLSGSDYLSAIQPCLQYGSVLANVTYAIGTMTGIVISREVIQENFHNAKRFGVVGSVISMAISVLALIVFFASGNAFAEPFINNNVDNKSLILSLAYTLLGITLTGQVFDAVRNSTTGVLRGFGKTVSPMVVNVLSTLTINVPLACASAFSPALKKENGKFNHVDGIFLARTLAILAGAITLYIICHRVVNERIPSKNRWCTMFRNAPFNSNNGEAAQLLENSKPKRCFKKSFCGIQ